MNSSPQRFASASRALREDVVPVGAQEQLESFDFVPDRFPFTGISNSARRIEDAHGVDLRNDVGALCNRLADRFE